MSMDLWGFKNAGELENNASELPDAILKEQIDLLGEKTNHVLCGKPMFLKIHSDGAEFRAATIFNVVVLALDDYTKTILIIYSNPEEEYPIAITVGDDIAEDRDGFHPKYRCGNKDDFIRSIKEILGSEDTMKTVQMLYSKAAVLVK